MFLIKKLKHYFALVDVDPNSIVELQIYLDHVIIDI